MPQTVHRHDPSTWVLTAPTRAQRVATMALGTLAWYALPDLVRSRRGRGVLKAGLLTTMFAGQLGDLGRAVGAIGDVARQVAHGTVGDNPQDAVPTVPPSLGVASDGELPSSTDDVVVPAGDFSALPANRWPPSSPPNPPGAAGPGGQRNLHTGQPGDPHLDGTGDADSATPLPPALSLATLATVPVAVIGLSLWASARAERWIFRRGEARRVEGHRAAHLRQAIPLALLTAVGEMIPLSGQDEDPADA